MGGIRLDFAILVNEGAKKYRKLRVLEELFILYRAEAST